MKISVIIATFKHKNRDIDLTNLMNSLLLKSNRDFIGEILIIDNGISISENQKEKYTNDIFRFINEPKIGLSIARNTGVKNAKCEIISFLDDDVVVNEFWGKSIVEAIEDKSIYCVGGAVIIKDFNELKPKWLTQYFSRFLFNIFPKKSCFLQKPFYVIGANMSFYQKTFILFGMFDEKLGRKGKCLMSGEDTEFIARIPEEKIWIETACIVISNISMQKLTKIYMVKRIFWQGVTDSIFIAKVGVDRFYDKNEFFYSDGFIKFALHKLLDFKFFEFFCVFVRLSGYYFGKIKIKKYANSK